MQQQQQQIAAIPRSFEQRCFQKMLELIWEHDAWCMRVVCEQLFSGWALGGDLGAKRCLQTNTSWLMWE